MKKSIASKVALAVLTAATVQVGTAGPGPAATAQPTQETSHHGCAKKLGGASCEKERCFGITKKAMNDCGTSKHACAKQAVADNQPEEWVNVLKGNCERIKGGSLTPPDGEES
jgi:uncharacterized membrane protein